MSGVKDGLVWWWDLNSADATITDQHNGLVLSRVGTTTTVSGGAPDGGDCVSCGNAQGKYRNSLVAKTIAYERGFSMNVWAFYTGGATFGPRLINHRDLSQPNWYGQLGMNHPSVGDFADVFSASGSLRSAYSGLPASPLNSWVMLTLVDTGSATFLYRNGVLVATGTTSLGAFGTGNAPLAIGGHAWQGIMDSGVDHFGRLSMAGVWDRPVTADEIIWLYNSGAGRRYNTLTYGKRDLGGEILWICPSLDDIGVGTVVARDLTTNRNHGILTNMDPPTDWVADTASGGVRALDFDGVNDRVICPSNLNALPTVHLSAWVFTTRATDFAIIGNDNGSYGRVVRAINSRFDVLNSQFISGLSNVVDIPLNQWFHIAVLWSQTAMTLHLNGSLVASAGGESAIYNDSTVTHLGQTGPGGSGQSLQGRLDDVRIFNRALTQTEITALASQRGYQLPSNTRRRRYAGVYGL